MRRPRLLITTALTLVAVHTGARADDLTPDRRGARTPAARASVDSPPVATAASAGGTCAEGATGDRTLGGHTFPFPLRQETAFVTTHFSIRQGAEFVTIPRFALGSLGRLDLSQAALTQNFDLGVKLYSSDRPAFGQVGVYATGGGRINLGASPAAVILAENSATANGQVGVVARALRLEDVGLQVSVRLFGGYVTGQKVDVEKLIDQIASNPEGSVQSVVRGRAAKLLLVPTSATQLGASLHGALAVRPWVSVQAALGLTRSREREKPFVVARNARVENSTSTTQVSVGVALTVDGSPFGIPLALVPEYTLLALSRRVDQTGDQGSGTESYVAAGLYYSGRRNLQVGVAVESQLGLQPIVGESADGTPTPSGKPRAFAGQFILRYVW